MSAPYWPQPRYLYHRSQPFGGTHGIFSTGTPWPLPDYVRNEASPLNGFGGTEIPGVGEVTCDAGAFINKFIKKLPTIPFGPFREAIKSALYGLSSGLMQQLMVKVGQGQGAFRTWFMSNVSYNIEQVSKGAVSQSMINAVVPMMFGYIDSALQECKASVYTGGGPISAGGGVTSEGDILDAVPPEALPAFYFDTLSPEFTEAHYSAKPDTLTSGMTTGAQLSSQIAARGGLQLTPAAAAARGLAPSGAAGGIPTMALVAGAAALAFLMLKR